MKSLAPRPWRVDREEIGLVWTNSCQILDADGGVVCHLTRGYQGVVIDGVSEDCPSWGNAELIVAAVNALNLD